MARHFGIKQLGRTRRGQLAIAVASVLMTAMGVGAIASIAGRPAPKEIHWDFVSTDVATADVPAAPTTPTQPATQPVMADRVVVNVVEPGKVPSKSSDTPAGGPVAAATSVSVFPEPGPGDYSLRNPATDRSDRLLQRELGKDSPLAGTGIIFGGYVQGGYTFNPQRSADDTIFGRVFDDGYGNSPQLDQVELSLSRRAARDKWDIGGRLEVIYGYDTFRFHSNGLNAYGSGCEDDQINPEGAQHDPRNQFDLTQAYLDVNVPVGNGLLVRAGKFVTPLGYETIDPTTTPFYSRSYLFGFAKPFTHTGVLLNYAFDERWEAWGGVVRGWDQSLNDNNDSVSFLGRVDWQANDRLHLRFGTIIGREGGDCGCDCDGSNGHRTLFDFIATYAVNDKLGLGAEVLYGRANHADSTGGSAEWYGVAGYASYLVSHSVKANARLEWFRDVDGVRLLTGSNLELTSLTLGLAVRPFADSRHLSPLTIQPEVRYDHATAPEFDGGSRQNQLTIGLGVLFAF